MAEFKAVRVTDLSDRSRVTVVEDEGVARGGVGGVLGPIFGRVAKWWKQSSGWMKLLVVAAGAALIWFNFLDGASTVSSLKNQNNGAGGTPQDKKYDYNARQVEKLRREKQELLYRVGDQQLVHATSDVVRQPNGDHHGLVKMISKGPPGTRLILRARMPDGQVRLIHDTGADSVLRKEPGYIMLRMGPNKPHQIRPAAWSAEFALPMGARRLQLHVPEDHGYYIGFERGPGRPMEIVAVEDDTSLKRALKKGRTFRMLSRMPIPAHGRVPTENVEFYCGR